MFYDLKDFPFLQNLVDNVDKVGEELLHLKNNSTFMERFYDYPPSTPIEEVTTHVDYWVRESGIHPDQIGYEARNGEWVAFALYKTGFPIKWFDVNKEFPFTIQEILKVPNVNFSAFFRIAPSAGSNEHSHNKANLIFHLTLYDLDGESVMRCNGEEKILSKKGDWCIFDYSKPHSSFNFSKTDRINLIIDFTPQKN